MHRQMCYESACIHILIYFEFEYQTMRCEKWVILSRFILISSHSVSNVSLNTNTLSPNSQHMRIECDVSYDYVWRRLSLSASILQRNSHLLAIFIIFLFLSLLLFVFSFLFVGLLVLCNSVGCHDFWICSINTSISHSLRLHQKCERLLINWLFEDWNEPEMWAT